MIESERVKIINFIQDFGCCDIKHLQILFNKPKDNFKDVLCNNFISKKGNIYVHNNSNIDKKMLIALDVLCKYKKKLKLYHKGFDPVYITFMTQDNTLYNIIVTDKQNEQGVLKLLKNQSPSIPEANKFIILFQDDVCFETIRCNTPYAYCIYPELKILNRRNT